MALGLSAATAVVVSAWTPGADNCPALLPRAAMAAAVKPAAPELRVPITGTSAPMASVDKAPMAAEPRRVAFEPTAVRAAPDRPAALVPSCDRTLPGSAPITPVPTDPRAVAVSAATLLPRATRSVPERPAALLPRRPTCAGFMAAKVLVGSPEMPALESVTRLLPRLAICALVSCVAA